MRLQSFYPIVVTEHLTACRDFYRRWFGLEVIFEASWFVLLSAGESGPANLAFMHPGHPSAPPGPERFNGQGMCLEFQVEDARAEHERFTREGAPITLSLRDEPFGQRRFGLFDPAGVWIDVVEQIEPAVGSVPGAHPAVRGWPRWLVLPVAVAVGCFDAAARYPADRLALTYPVPS
jgi:catechol 2,3-dioxygenase-like lactoylglutathione lyase family enzyme